MWNKYFKQEAGVFQHDKHLSQLDWFITFLLNCFITWIFNFVNYKEEINK